jgi:hypothetical protein
MTSNIPRRAFLSRFLLPQLASLPLLQACGRPRSSDASLGDIQANASESASKPFLMPYLESQGTAWVSLRIEFLETGDDGFYLQNPEGAAFGGRLESENPIEPYPPEIAIWRDGTMAWVTLLADGERISRIGFCEKQGREKLAALLRELRNDLRKLAPKALSHLLFECVALDTISVCDGSDRYVFASDLLGMQKIGEYRYRSGSTEMQMPVTEDNLSEFLSKLSGLESLLYRAWARLYECLASLIPREGKRVSMTHELSWVVQRGTRYGLSP